MNLFSFYVNIYVCMWFRSGKGPFKMYYGEAITGTFIIYLFMSSNICGILAKENQMWL